VDPADPQTSCISKAPACARLSSLPKSSERRQRQSEPRSVSALSGHPRHACTAATGQHQKPRFRESITNGIESLAWRSPANTFCPKARGLSPQHLGEQAPSGCAAKPCLPCLRLYWKIKSNNINCELTATLCMDQSDRFDKPICSGSGSRRPSNIVHLKSPGLCEGKLSSKIQ